METIALSMAQRPDNHPKPSWRNGRLASMRGWYPQGRGGSTPPDGTGSQVTMHHPRIGVYQIHGAG